ncbi:pentapeptide repeat-containing protein [Streptomyces iconiensis]|uniref:Pentapeptide repeat-containing protein n=1 Tax=Streptomyces iconiensis TaxID=1384038 RepID=A0ABT6ZSH1_9ACTN|nr:pentapeptide repeat-containing protein [Streptomyces iconiensis]MDJ1132018.1 pentapeptide repeat-containing protein [Streptomyces iconiensis]
MDWARRIELGSVVLASLVAVGGLWYTAIQTQQANQQSRAERMLAKEAQITDRYTAAVENLGDKKVDVRLGGVYALERIMQDSPRDHPTIANVLNTYVRTHAGERQLRSADKSRGKSQDTPNGDEKNGELPADVQAALTVLVTRDTSHDRNFTLNFMNAQLADADLTAPDDPRRSAMAQLQEANLRDVNLRGADLSGAYLRGTNLRGTNLRDADLSDAYLRGTILHDTNLRNAFLSEADLRGTDLRDTNLRAADLRAADLSGAYLSGAYLSGAILFSADLRGTDLSGADLSGADLSGADLSGADLSGADLSGADLRDADLSGANRKYAARHGAIT